MCTAAKTQGEIKKTFDGTDAEEEFGDENWSIVFRDGQRTTEAKKTPMNSHEEKETIVSSNLCIRTTWLMAHFQRHPMTRNFCRKLVQLSLNMVECVSISPGHLEDSVL